MKKPTYNRRVAARVGPNLVRHADVKVNPLLDAGNNGQRARIKSMSSEEMNESKVVGVEAFELQPRKYPSSPHLAKAQQSPSTSCNNLP